MRYSGLRSSPCSIGALCMALVLSALATSTWAQAGRVRATCGSVFMAGPAGAPVAARIGDAFESGTSFNTGPDSRVVLAFADGQSVALGPGSTFRIVQFRFDANNLKASASVEALLSGTMRYVTGAIHRTNRGAANISAGRSKIDILNAGAADFAIMIDSTAGEPGAAAVKTGEIAVNAPLGRSATIASGQFGRWGSDRAPTPGAPLAAAPAVIQAAIGALQGSQPLIQTSAGAECDALETVLAALTGGGQPLRTVVTPYISPVLTPGGGGGGGRCVGSPC